MKPHIPNPCHEDWNQMLPEERGRHCLACSRTVIDFTDWEPDAIRDYMIRQKEEKVCGRFMESQLDMTPEPEVVNWPVRIAQSGLSFFKKVAAVIVVVFGLAASSCDNTVQVLGEPMPPKDSVENRSGNKKDSAGTGQDKPEDTLPFNRTAEAADTKMNTDGAGRAVSEGYEPDSKITFTGFEMDTSMTDCVTMGFTVMADSLPKEQKKKQVADAAAILSGDPDALKASKGIKLSTLNAGKSAVLINPEHK
jgi:hypothetical protein